jgi:outer membrane protein TolC
MMKLHLLKICLSVLITVFLFIPKTNGQQLVSLSDCYTSAIRNHPAGLQIHQLDQLNSLQNKIISSSWLPQANLLAQATYQSDVLNLGITFPGINIPSQAHDQYRVHLDIHQVIYDGGMSRQRQILQQAGHLADMQEVEVKQYAVIEQVNRHFFAHFTLADNSRIIGVNLDEIRQRLSSVQSAVENGALPPATGWMLEAEVLKLAQMQEELRMAQQNNLEILQILTGMDLSESELQLPEINTISPRINRPELKLFDLQREKLNAAAHLTGVRNRPMVSAFVQPGYGRPGLNMLSEDFDWWYIAGVRLTWTLWDWNKTRNEKQLNFIRAEMIDPAQELFEQGISIATSSLQTRMQQAETAMQTEAQIIELLQKIANSAGSQLQNGTMSATDYLHHVNALTLARIRHNTHRISRLQSIAEHNVITGNIH